MDIVKKWIHAKGLSKWVISTVAALFIALAIGGVAYWQYSAQLEYIDGNVLNLPYVNQWSEDDLLDNPWKNAQFYTALMYRNLFLADSSFEIVSCDLAASYQISDDGLTYSITLKEDLQWSDGEPLTMADVVFSIESVLRSNTANGLYTAAFAKIEGYAAFLENPDAGLSGLEVTDTGVLVMHLDTTHPTMLQVLAQLAILPAHCFEDADIPNIDADDYWKDPVVSGMYQVGEVVPYETVQLVRNKYYSEQAPKIDEVILHVNYKFANLDYYSTNNITEIINYRSIRSMSEYKVDLLFYRYFVFNLNETSDGETSPLQDSTVREAIALAIDRETLLYEIYLDSGTLLETGVPTTHDSYNGQTLTYDPDAAAELLAASDYDLSRPLRLAYYYTDTTSAAFMAAVAEDLEAIGFTVELCAVSNSTELYEDRVYDLLLKGLSAFDVSEWYIEYTAENGNLSRLFDGDDEFGVLVKALSSTVDPAEEDALLQELQVLEQETLYKLPLFTLSQVVYINEDRVNVPSGCTFGNTWYKYDIDFENWSIKKE